MYLSYRNESIDLHNKYTKRTLVANALSDYGPWQISKYLYKNNLLAKT